MRSLAVILGLGVVGTLAFVAWTRTAGSRAVASSKVPAANDSEAAPTGPRIFAGGIVEGSHRELSLRFDVSGRIKSVHVQEGDVVKAGDVLAELETEEAELRMAQAMTQLKIVQAERDKLIVDSRAQAREVARAKLALAEKRVRDTATLVEQATYQATQDPAANKGLAQLQQKQQLAESQLEDLHAEYEAPRTSLTREEKIITEGKIALAENAIRRERLLLDKHHLVSPIDATVLRARAEPGELIGPGGDPDLFILVNRGGTRVRAYVEELDAMQVKPGQRASVTAPGYPGREYPGTIVTCSPHVRPKSHRHLKPGERLDVRVREVVITLEKGADLLIGMPVEVFIARETPAEIHPPKEMPHSHSSGDDFDTHPPEANTRRRNQSAAR